jgi:hypothetical protein
MPTANATEQAFAPSFRALKIRCLRSSATGRFEQRRLADSILISAGWRRARRSRAPFAGALQSAFAGGGLFGLFHEGGIAGERPPAVRYADAEIFEHAPRYHGGGLAVSGLLTDEVPSIARGRELVVSPERVVREDKTAGEQRPITVVVQTSLPRTRAPFRASQGKIAADMARDRSGEPESMSGIQFRGAIETLKVLPW